MGIFKKPKTPPPTAQEKELERRQRSDLDELVREENERLKAIKRGARGRRSLLGGSITNIGTGGGTNTGGGAGGGGVRGRGGAGGGGGRSGSPSRGIFAATRGSGSSR